MSGGRVAAAAATAALVGAVAWGVGFERHWYALRRERLTLLRTTGCLRVLLFTDLHYVPGQRRRLDWVRRVVDATDPDLLVSGGDLLEDGAGIDDVVALHADLLDAGRVGVALLGAHDFYAPTFLNPARYLLGPSPSRPRSPRFDTGRLVAGLRAGGWRVMENARATVPTRNGLGVDVAALGDPHVDRDDPWAFGWEAPRVPVALRLGLVHAPYRRSLERFDAAGFDLALAGHTHGGQLCVPGFGALVSNSDLPPALARGTSPVFSDLLLHVSAGLGHSRYAPMRFACRPEATLLEIVPR